MKTILFLFLVLTAPAVVFAASDYTLAPDGTYVNDGKATLAPDGTYVGGDRATLAPDGSYVGGNRATLVRSAVTSSSQRGELLPLRSPKGDVLKALF